MKTFPTEWHGRLMITFSRLHRCLINLGIRSPNKMLSDLYDDLTFMLEEYKNGQLSR